MITGAVDPAPMFMVGTALALMLNYPSAEMQRTRIEAHAKAALTMGAILLAAGSFTGIMKGSGMLEAMASASVRAVPPAMAMHIPFVARSRVDASQPALRSGFVLPWSTAGHRRSGQNVWRATIQVGQAALLGQMTTGFPVSPLTPATFLVVGLARIELGEHQKFTAPYLFAASVLMTLVCVLVGVFPL